MIITPARAGRAGRSAALYSVADIAVSSAAHTDGSWGSWEAVTFLTGVALMFASLIVAAIADNHPLHVPLHLPGCRNARPGELPGLIWIMLAGAPCRRQTRQILARREPQPGRRSSSAAADTRPPPRRHRGTAHT